MTIEELYQKLTTNMEQKFATLETKIDALEDRLDGFDKKLSSLDKGVDVLYEKFDSKIDKLENIFRDYEINYRLEKTLITNTINMLYEKISK